MGFYAQTEPAAERKSKRAWKYILPYILYYTSITIILVWEPQCIHSVCVRAHVVCIHI